MTAAQSTTTSQKEGHLSLKTVISYAMSYGSGYQIMVLASVWDAINDPMMGVIADKTHTRFGKYRPYFLWVPACLTVVVILLLSYVHLPFIDDRIHTHNHFEINYVYSGSARQIIDSEQRKLLAGEFCIFAPNMWHNVLVDDTDSLVISIPVRKSTFDSIFGRLMTQNDLLSLFFKNTLYQEHQSNYLLFKTDPADQEITALIRHITIESNSSRKYAAAYVDCLVPQLFYTLLRRYSDAVLYYGSGSKDPTQSDFALMLTYVQNHYTDITLTELARLFGYSPEYVSRLFTRNMHQSFNQIVQDLRMQKAAELLRTTSLSISAVTEQCGYTSPDYFTRNFRRHFHCSPTEYRKQTAR